MLSQLPEVIVDKIGSYISDIVQKRNGKWLTRISTSKLIEQNRQYGSIPNHLHWTIQILLWLR